MAASLSAVAQVSLEKGFLVAQDRASYREMNVAIEESKKNFLEKIKKYKSKIDETKKFVLI